MIERIRAVLRDADVLIVVPPFAWMDRPALGAHLLQGVTRQHGLEAQVLYMNFAFAAWFDEGTHDTIGQMQYGLFLGERLFVRDLFGGPPLGSDGGAGITPTLDALARGYARMGVVSTFTLPAILRVEARIPALLDAVAGAVAGRSYRVVGATSSFEQTLSSVALLGRIKRTAPQIVTVLGGANCEGEMAEGVAALSDRIDHVFSGESDVTFGEFLDRLAAGEPSERIIRGAPVTDLDALPTPDFDDYFAQLRAVLPHSKLATSGRMQLAYETSRGCWWGAKSHCTFCGLNGQGMASRAKSPERVLGELEALVKRHGVRRIAMTDNIMPHDYFKTVLPELPARIPDLHVMYEEKANLSLRQVQSLVAAGVREIQPGIEALSTGLLKLMGKGTTAAQNVALLRYARIADLLVQWNLLHGFPGDELAFYRETLELMASIHHLQPPVSPCPVVIDRFSPYHSHPERYGISNLRPYAFYRGVFPDHVPVDKLAYHFEGDFASEARATPALAQRLGDEVAAWRRRFYGPSRPELRVVVEGASYRIVDTRELAGVPAEQPIDEAQASAALVTRPLRTVPADVRAWAREMRVAVERDGKLVPLATCEAELLEAFEQRAKRPAHQLAVL